MTSSDLLELLGEVERGALTPEVAAQRLATLPFEEEVDAGWIITAVFAPVLPEVVFAAGKTAEQTVAIFAGLASDGVDVSPHAPIQPPRGILARHPAAIHNAVARTVALRQSAGADREPDEGHVAVICAGTSDLPIAEEAALRGELWDGKRRESTPRRGRGRVCTACWRIARHCGRRQGC